MKKFLLISLTVILLFSCSSQINGVLREGGSADLAISASLEPRMSALIRSISALAGNTGSETILDGPSISRSIAASPGVQSAALANTGPEALEGKIVIAKVDDFLSLTGKTPFITYSENRISGKPSGRMLISLDLNTAPDLIALLSEEAVDYLTALMAPAVIGAELTKVEYLFLVGTLYGQPVANEIRSARIKAEIELPGPVISIRGGTASGSKAVFDIPLLDILVLETPQSWEIAW